MKNIIKNIIKYTIGLPILLIFTITLLFVEFIHILCAYLIVAPCRFILTGEFEKEELLFFDDIIQFWEPINSEGVR